MSKAHSSWQKTLNLSFADGQLPKMSGWLLALAIAAILWCLNWKLFLATGVGISLMSCCYLWQNSHWQRYFQQWQNFLSGSNRQLLVAVSSGAIASFCTYVAASVWADAENQWLATGEILQGFASLGTLGILLWSLRQKKDKNLNEKLDTLLADLSHPEALKRLVAIRQLTRLLIERNLPADYYAQSIEYFQLMLAENQPAIIKNALLESLELLDDCPIALKSTKVRIPLNLKHSHKSIRLRDY